MAISFVNVGTAGTGGSGNVTPAAPASLRAGDILYLIIHSRDNVAHSVDNGFQLLVEGMPDALNHLSIWWKRTNGTEGTTTVTHASGDSICSRMYAYRGGLQSGNPFNVVGAVQTNAGS